MTQIAGKAFSQVTNLNVKDELRVDKKLISSSQATIYNVASLDNILEISTVVGDTITLPVGIINIIGGIIDVEDYRFILDDQTFFTGSDRYATGFLSSTTGALFTINGVICSFREIYSEARNGSIFDIGSGSVVRTNGFYIANCITVGVSLDFTSLDIVDFVLENTSVGGLTFSGLNNGPLRVIRSDFKAWSGVVFDMGAALFDSISISGGNDVNAVGKYFATGLQGGANIKAGGLGFIIDNHFHGGGIAGRYFNNVDEATENWLIKSNSDIPDTQRTASIYTTVPLIPTATILDTEVIVNGAYQQQSGAFGNATSQFATTAAGKITYTGAQPASSVYVSAAIQGTPVTGTANIYDFYIKKNDSLGNPLLVVASKSPITASANIAGNANCQCIINFDPGDTVDIVCYRRSASNVDVECYVTFVIKQ